MTLSRVWPGSRLREVPRWAEVALADSAVPSAVVGSSGQIHWTNRAFRSLLGQPEDGDGTRLPLPLPRVRRPRKGGPASPASFFDLGPDAGGPIVQNAVRDATSEVGRATTLHQQVMTIGERHLSVDLTITSVADSNPAAQGGLALVQLVDRSSESLNTSRALRENALDVVVLATRSGRVTWISPSVADVLGLDPDNLSARPLADLLPAEDVPRLNDLLAMGAGGSQATRDVLRLRSASGAFRSMSVSARPHVTEPGQSIVALGMRDVTDELRAKRELARSEEQFRMAMLGAPEGMAVADAHDRIVQVNPALCELLGRGASTLIGHRFREFIPIEQRDLVDQWRDRLVQGPASAERLQHPMTTPTSEVWVDHSIGIMRDDAGVPTLFVHQFADRTAARMIQADLAYRASHDSQTGLANRASLMTRLGQRLGEPQRSSEVVGVLFADIDNLKPINDRLGHPIGDTVIATVAARLQQAVRRHDVVARVGGDEFAIVLERCSTIRELEVVARNVQQAASAPVATPSGPVDVTITVGAVLAASSADTDLTLARVDEALYEAKRAGRNRFAVSPVLVEG